MLASATKLVIFIGLFIDARDVIPMGMIPNLVSG